jgi:hypothetical protein
MALAHDLDLLPLVMVVGNLVRLGLAAPALAACVDFSSHDENCPSPLEGEVREGGEAPPRLAWRGAP